MQSRNWRRARVVLLALGVTCGPARGEGMQEGAPAAAYPPSNYILGVTFDIHTLKNRCPGNGKEAPGSDNWAITWADDGRQYASWGDGGGFGGTNREGRVSMGVARIEGSKEDYRGYNVWGGKDAPNPAAFGGKCYGLLSIDGTMYLWRTGDASNQSCFKRQELYRSTDHGASWRFTGAKYVNRDDFPHSLGFFAPTFLQFGRDYRGARDEYVYIFAPEVKNDRVWNVQRPGEVALIRVKKNKLEEQSAYEYFRGVDGGGGPRWTRHVEDRSPVFRDSKNGVMRLSVSYNAPLKRYFLIVQQVDRRRQRDHFGMYEAPEPWGPWKTVLFRWAWDLPIHRWTDGEYNKTVYWNFSNKWLSRDGKRFVMVYTGPGNDQWGTVEGTFSVSGDTDANNGDPE